MGLSNKQVRVASPRQGEGATVEDEWKQCIVDMLEISNTECHALQMQLKGILQAWDATNVELRSAGAHLGGIHQGVEYLTGMAWKRHTVSWENLVRGRGEG